ncbi:MAG: hypothetical protein JWP89_1585 [Schlesneria sp.]|nr:hypothetical protein [Schlesneria sp.]
MASLVDYRGLQVVSPDPTGDGGLAIQNNLKNLVNWSPKGVWAQTTNPTASNDNTDEYYPGSFWLRTNTTPSQLFVCKSSATAAAEWLPLLLAVSQDSAPKLGGDLVLNGHKITDSTTIALAIAGTTVASATSNSLQVQANFLVGTTTIPTGATFNNVLGGGPTSPVLGAATADVVCMAAVDKAVGDRRLYIQSEAGTPISLGNNRLNFSATTGFVSVGGTDAISVTSSKFEFLQSIVGVPSTGLAIVVPSTTSTAESLWSWSVSDDTSQLVINNATASDALFTPRLNGIQSAAGTALNVTGSGTTDTGGNPLLLFVGQLVGGTKVSTRPLCQFWNLNVSALEISAGLNLRLQGGATTPVLASAAADTVSLAPVDKAAGDRRLYIQSESGSAISLGGDRLNFSASTGGISVGGTDVLTANATGIAIAGKVTNYNGLSAVGVPITVASAYLITNAAVTSFCSYTVPAAADAVFEVACSVLVKATSSSYNFAAKLSYTDTGGTARTATLVFQLVGGTTTIAVSNAGGGVAPYLGIPVRFRAKAGTTISIATSGTFAVVLYDIDASLILQP